MFTSVCSSISYIQYLLNIEYLNSSFIEVCLVLKLFRKWTSSSSDFVHIKRIHRYNKD